MRALKRLNAWINDAALRDVDSRLCITEISEPEADTTMEWATSPGTSGQRLVRRTRQAKKVRVEFDIRELLDLTARAAIVTAANGWAADGILKVSYRPGQQLRVMLSQAANIEGARDVTGKFTIEFQTGAYPYWEDEVAEALALSGSMGSGTLRVPGQAATQPEIDITPSSSTLTGITLTIGGKAMEFSGISVSSGTTLKIRHDDRGLLTVKAGSTSLLNKRTAASADDWLLKPGSASVSYTANTACAVNVRARGRYL